MCDFFSLCRECKSGLFRPRRRQLPRLRLQKIANYPPRTAEVSRSRGLANHRTRLSGEVHNHGRGWYLMSIQEIAPEQLAQLFHHYHQALAADSHCDDASSESWEHVPPQEKSRLVAAARLALLEL